MKIDFIAPLSSAWNRMQKALFKPFDIKKWFALGFTAFLANLLDWEGGNSADDESGHFDFGEVLDIPHQGWDWVQRNPDWTTLIVIAIAVIAALVILLTWISSRGKFMFLDNVVHNRALVKKPWADFASIAKSLFLWRMGFGVVGFIILGSYMSYIYFEIYDMYNAYASDSDMIIAAIRMGVFFIILAIAFSYISLFLNDFIVPIMYKNSSSAWIGWSNFMPIFQQHLVYFILYGLFILFLYILVVILVIIVGLLTCCIGFLFLIIPYIGSVFLLPVSVVFRAISIEFLEQFGNQFKIFPEEDASIETASE